MGLRTTDNSILCVSVLWTYKIRVNGSSPWKENPFETVGKQRYSIAIDLLRTGNLNRQPNRISSQERHLQLKCYFTTIQLQKSRPNFLFATNQLKPKKLKLERFHREIHRHLAIYKYFESEEHSGF